MEVEYLDLFSKEGSLKVKVKFEKSSGAVTSRRMEPDEILKIISPVDGHFYSRMTFDEWPFEISKYVIDPINNELIIHARQPSNDC